MFAVDGMIKLDLLLPNRASSGLLGTVDDIPNPTGRLPGLPNSTTGEVRPLAVPRACTGDAGACDSFDTEGERSC